MLPANSVHSLHDGVTFVVDSRHQGLAQDARGIETHFGVVDGHVSLPSQVIPEVKLVGGIAHGELVQPSMTQARFGCGRHFFKRSMFTPFGKQAGTTTNSLGARHVLRAFHCIGRCGVRENPVGHVLHSNSGAELSTFLTKTLELLPLPVPLESEAPARPGKVDSSDRNTRGHRNLFGGKESFFPVDYHVQGPVGEAGGRSDLARTL